MNLKKTALAAACAALFGPSAFAVTPLACDKTSTVTRVNTCAPEVKLFIAGSSALGGALSIVAPVDLFDNTVDAAFPLMKIVDTASPNAAVSGAVSGWYGMSKPAVTGGTSKRLFVVYNNNNGSAAGVSQLLAKLGTVSEADVVTVGPTKNIANTCVAGTAVAASGSVPAMEAANCSSHAMTQADIAITDTHPAESYKLYASATAKLTTLTSTPLAMQGFGIAVNPKLYEALVNQNIADGVLPSSCATDANSIANTAGVPGTSTAACQPSLRSVNYTSLISRVGTIKSIAGLVPSVTLAGVPADDLLVLARRDALSGTQASSNIYFAANSCGNNHDAKGKLIAGVRGGQLDIISNGTDAATGAGATNDSTAALTVLAAATSGAVKTALNATTGYAIGVLGLGSQGGSDQWKFVKIDGSSPNFVSTDGGATYAAAYKLRKAMLDGSYKFQVASYAAVKTKKDKNSVGDLFPGVPAAVIAGLQDSTQHDLTAIGYLDGATDNPATPKQSLVRRHEGNNCSPLVKAAS